MSEMSAEKKKEIEKYIIKSYFGGGKNVESWVGGGDVIKGTDDGHIPQLLVEVTYFGGSGLVIINWDIYYEAHDSEEWANSFAMRVCREREIEQNRCDSVDAMLYAWESWRSKIQGKPIFLKTNDEDLQKDKRIEELEKEISDLRADKNGRKTLIAHLNSEIDKWKRHYDDVSVRNEEFEKEVEALRAEREVRERHIQELESQNVSLAETIKDKKCIEFSMHSMIATHVPYKEDTEITIAGTAPGNSLLLANNPFDIPCDVVVVPKRDFERLKAENEQLKKKSHEYDTIPDYNALLAKLYSKDDVEKLEWTLNHICGGRASVNGWIAVSLFWKHEYETLLKLVGFSSVEEIQDYLTNEAECDTLHEAIFKMIDENKYTCEEWCKANSSNNSWKAAAECNSPKELLEKLNLLRNYISGRSTAIESYKRTIEKWQKATGYLRPEDISTDSMVSKSTANEIKAANERLWSENAKCEKRIDALLSEIREWKNATGRISPEEAKQYIDRLKDRLNKIHDCSVCW